jgi:hypothetical protein
MSEKEIFTEFENNVIAFMDELIVQFPLEADLILYRIYLKDQIDIKTVMDTCLLKIQTTPKIRKNVKERNESFFLQTNFLSGPKATRLKTLWLSGKLDRDDKKTFWAWIDSFVYLIDKYVKVLSAPKIKKDDVGGEPEEKVEEKVEEKAKEKVKDKAKEKAKEKVEEKVEETEKEEKIIK